MEKFTTAYKELVDTERFIFANLNWGDDEIRTLSSFLPSCHALERLDLAANKIGDIGMASLAPALPRNLKYLSLSSNQIRDAGAQSLAQALAQTSLQELRLNNNKIGDSGCKSFAQVLPYTDLKCLELFGNSGIKSKDILLNAAPDGCKVNM